MKLMEGEYLCPKCKGSGLYDNNYKPIESFFIAYECMYCKGEGTIDWITNIVGKKSPYHVRSLTLSKSEFEWRIKGISL
jgi:DnaJ-class molecular chaperone